jgi:hypothetical protein
MESNLIVTITRNQSKAVSSSLTRPEVPDMQGTWGRRKIKSILNIPKRASAMATYQQGRLRANNGTRLAPQD